LCQRVDFHASIIQRLPRAWKPEPPERGNERPIKNFCGLLTAGKT
jgi:hypothetical protein